MVHNFRKSVKRTGPKQRKETSLLTQLCKNKPNATSTQIQFTIDPLPFLNGGQPKKRTKRVPESCPKGTNMCF